MLELCQWVININYLAARLRQIYSKPAARFICMVKTNCRNLAVGLRQSSSKLAARSPLALPQGLFFGKGRTTLHTHTRVRADVDLDSALSPAG